MKKIIQSSFLTLLFSFLLISTYAQVTSTLELASFNKIELDISANITIKQGSTQKVEVTGPQDLIDLLNKEVNGEEWDIKYTKRNVKTTKTLEITITVEHLEEIDVNGSGDIKGVSAFHEDEMEISVNGSGNIDLEIYVKELEIDINGSGDVNLSGTADKLEVSINGSGDIKATDLQVEYAEFSVNGSGDSKLHVTKKLSATINGSGDIHYKGDPNIKTHRNGSGSIKNID